ncbi:hypothetical protein [endosymbiont 'TC1' of Trimyema compressum]|uniref:hypothetical protein n=1 Tax=endosymbiont 'TC1' of Trimyema compressum TaxID=243899 RepID=UPI002480F5C6|nr:hypothetical protein [endosymbiont 'TC1' of Trimyema compressum]
MSTGIYLNKKIGDYVKVGEIFVVAIGVKKVNKEKLVKAIREGYGIGHKPIETKNLIIDVVQGQRSDFN